MQKCFTEIGGLMTKDLSHHVCPRCREFTYGLSHPHNSCVNCGFHSGRRRPLTSYESDLPEEYRNIVKEVDHQIRRLELLL